MKKIFFLFLLVLFTSKAFSQVEFSYEYKTFVLQGPPGELTRLYNQANNNEKYHALSDILAALGPQGWRYIGISQKYDPSMPVIVMQDYIFERATRIDHKTVQDAIDSSKAEFEKIAKDEAEKAATKLKLELIAAMKDVKLYDDTYRNMVIEAAIQKFKVELDKAIKEAVPPKK